MSIAPRQPDFYTHYSTGNTVDAQIQKGVVPLKNGGQFVIIPFDSPEIAHHPSAEHAPATQDATNRNEDRKYYFGRYEPTQGEGDMQYAEIEIDKRHSSERHDPPGGLIRLIGHGALQLIGKGGLARVSVNISEQ